MKRFWYFHGGFLGLYLLADAFFAFLLWLILPASLPWLLPILILFSALSFLLGCLLERQRLRRKRAALEAFLREPENAASLLREEEAALRPAVAALADRLRERELTLRDKEAELSSYREFIEGWVHELKTPLSLFTLLLDNHRDELSPYVSRRLEHVRGQISRDAERILYYARLSADHVDDCFEPLSLDELVTACLDDCRLLCEERGVRVLTDLAPLTVVSDRRALRFLLSQLCSNACRYAAGENGLLTVSAARQGDAVVLTMRNNGASVPPEDRPFLFDKGFTGSHPGRQTATGMGLYFVKRYADALSLTVALENPVPAGMAFGITLTFPEVTKDRSDISSPAV